MVAKRRWLLGLLSLPVACGGGDGVAPPLPPCTSSGFAVNLALAGDYTAIDPGPDSGCTVFPAAPAGSPVEYLLVPQSASAKPNDSQGFTLVGALLAATAVAPEAIAAEEPVQPTLAEQFHHLLRRSERDLVAGAPVRTAPATGAQPAAQLPPVDSGNVRTFKVCAVLECDTRKPSTLTTVTATARKTGPHVAIFVDNNHAPLGGLTEADVNALRDVFDTLLYGVGTVAFGAESDVDTNGQIIILMTGKVNQLIPSPECTTQGSVIGFFFGADLLTSGQGGTGNFGEIFYSGVADPSGTLSCARSATQVKQSLPGTFVHEFQHMISFNQHFLVRGGLPEDLWLNEALSHYAEERAGRTFLPGDSATFCLYIREDLRNAGLYLANPEDHFLVDTSGIGEPPERGSYWLFLRYLIDQFAADTSLAAADVFTRSLVATSATGAANVIQRTGNTPFPTLVSHWGLANWVSDLPGFTPPPELEYKSWSFRTAFPLFNQTCSFSIPFTFPLVPGTSAGSAVDLTGVLRAGSGRYHRAQQSAAAPGFTLLFSDDAGRALRTSLVPRLNVIRIQ